MTKEGKSEGNFHLPAKGKEFDHLTLIARENINMNENDEEKVTCRKGKEGEG